MIERSVLVAFKLQEKCNIRARRPSQGVICKKILKILTVL
jgi:hypothetical protein